MKLNVTPDIKENSPDGPFKKEKLFLVNGRYSTVHHPDRVSIIEIRDHKKIGNVHPLASIPVAASMTDAGACILALRWLRDHNYITAEESDRHEKDCMTAESRGRLKVLRHDELDKYR